ncbi:MAG: tetratricopeptide (TPR) repeat protein [Acidimicrobiales bacterium]
MDYYDLGHYSRTITTTSPDTQLWFERGLNWLYAFNHAEAISCFENATEADATCAMAYWGKAIALGPNYNMPWHLMDRLTKSKLLGGAHGAMSLALANLDGCTAGEVALIEALESRYPQADPIEDQMPWNKAFTNAMRTVQQAHPEDRDIAAVFVDAILNETPWQMWNLKTGGVADGAGTVEAREVLEHAFATMPSTWEHPGLLHLYVHLMEMSPFPELALRAGDRLRQMVPDSGHLIHMPTHLDVLCGNYNDVVVYNQKAVEADRRWVEREGVYNIYTLYRNHNHHFVIYGAMFMGRYTAAMEAAQELIDTIPEDFLRIESPPFADAAEAFIGMKQHVLVRFGRWQEIIDQDLPDDPELYSATTALMRYAKAVAHSALGNVPEAEAEKAAFLEAKAAVPETRRVHNNTVVDVLEVAEAMLNGELEYRRGNFETAFGHLRKAVEIEDNLLYDEPWGWMQPTRHALGALLLEQERYEEAEAVYRSDLGLDATLSRASQHPNNLWSLHGLHQCLSQRGEEAECRLVKQQLDLALARSEVEVNASCYCSQAAMAGG